jgi:hypothetical protein
VHPYLNRRINNFQRLALISQFFTILGIRQSLLPYSSELICAILIVVCVSEYFRTLCIRSDSFIGGLKTIPGCIIYLMQALSELQDEVNPSDGDKTASYLLAWFILAINWITGVAYPMYR